MRYSTAMVAVFLLLGLLLVGLSGWSEAGESKQLVLVFTTDTGGELNPCG
jgi:hypothetical protein